MKRKLVIVEGNICAGKSTLAGKLGKIIGSKVFIEPALENPYLERFYKNPQKYALTMQLYLLRDRYMTYVKALKLVEQGNSVILDRSIFSDYVFAAKNYKDGNISKEGFQYYLKVRNKMLSGLPHPDMVVYLHVPAKTCHTRITHLRKRKCESVIPLEYLQGLEDCYEELLEDMEERKCNVLRVDWSDFGKIKNVSDLMQKKMSKKEKCNGNEVKILLKNEREVMKRMMIKWNLNELHFDEEEIKKENKRWEMLSPFKKKR